MRSPIPIFFLFLTGTLHCQQKLPTGKIIDTIACSHQPTQSYALYLPKNYGSNSTWPIIFVFDPMARGPLAAKVFAPAAEELGYIIAASNNSRNGSWQIALDAADAMFVDVPKGFFIDTSRIYTSGFSGGSRVAMGVAVITKRVRGVIGCGAGFPNTPGYRPTIGDKFSYVGLVGDKDMNYLEHIAVENELNQIGIKNLRLVFDGIHRWPPAHQVKLALQWLELQAQQLGHTVGDHWSVHQAFELLRHRADSLFGANRLVLAAQAYQQLQADFEGIADLDSTTKTLDDLRKNKEYKKQSKIDQRYNQKEKEHQYKIGEAFTQAMYTKLNTRGDSSLKGEDWWHKEIDLLKKLSRSAQVDKSNMALRLLNLIWAKFATASFNFFAQGDLESAILFNKMWLYVEPGSQWGHWSIAKVYAKKGEYQYAIDHIMAAVEKSKSFTVKLVVGEPLFAPLLEYPQIKTVMAQEDRKKLP